MKKIKKLFLILLTSILFTNCHRISPDGGTESALMVQPVFFGKGGVDPVPISSGSVWRALSTKEINFTITPQTITEEFKDMIPADNTPVSFNAYLKIQIQKGKTPILYKNFGKDWYIQSLQSTFRTMVRDKACVYKMFDLASKREISSSLEKNIYKDILAYANKLKLPVDILQVSIGAITPPQEVLSETKLTAAQNQSVLTQNARKTSEDARKAAEEAKAVADVAYKNKFGMSTPEYLELRHIEIEKEKVELVRDNKNATIIFGIPNAVINANK